MAEEANVSQGTYLRAGAIQRPAFDEGPRVTNMCGRADVAGLAGEDDVCEGRVPVERRQMT